MRLIKHVAFFIIILTYSNVLYAQFDLHISGRIVSNVGTDAYGVPNCYIKVASAAKNTALAYFNTGNTNEFTKTVSAALPDTILVTVSCTGYTTTTVKRYVAKNQSELALNSIVLPIYTKSLDSVVVKSQPIWVRGDTTFFSADAFKEGNEKKLKDLIAKMPGFEIDDNGNLLYKKKIVEKITMDGEDIFADKIRLLLNSFPVYVLANIQAVENQSEHKLLKGLTGENRTFVNLGLNKNKLKTAFGDGNAGTGTGKKYFINPTMFSLYGKIKAGYVGNMDNTGMNIGWRPEAELKKNTLPIEQWMINNMPLQIINNFESNRYIVNNQTDNRLQVNTPINKNIKLYTETGYLTDKQKQSVYQFSGIYNDTGFFKRTDSTFGVYQPRLLSVSEKLTWSIDSSKELNTTFSFLYNGNEGRQSRRINQLGALYSTNTAVKNRFKDYAVSIDFIHRISPERAVSWFIKSNVNHSPQTGTGISDSWSGSFSLPNSGYTDLHLVTHADFINFTGGIKWLYKTKGNPFSFTILSDWQQVNISSSTMFSEANQPDYLLPNYTDTGRYEAGKISVLTDRRVYIFNVPVNISFEGGISRFGAEEHLYNKTVTVPFYKIGIDQKNKFGKFNSLINIDVSQSNIPLYEIYNMPLPSSIASYQYNSNTFGKSVKKIQAEYVIDYSPDFFNSFAMLFWYNRDFSAFASSNRFNGIAQLSTDSLVQRPKNSFHANFNANITSLALNAKIALNADFSRSENYLTSAGGLQKSIFYFYAVGAEMRKKWNKKYYIVANVHYVTQINRLPLELQNNIDTKVSNLVLSLKQTLIINKQHNIVYKTQWYNNNLFSDNKTAFVFGDVEYSYNPENKNFSFTLGISNIFNQKLYSSVDNSPTQQSFYYLPLINRNALLSISYRL